MPRLRRPLAFLLLLTPCLARGQSIDHARPVTGPAAAAMGGAFTAIADDLSAIAWNPAGLVQISRREVTIVPRVRLAFPSVEVGAPNVSGEGRFSHAGRPVEMAALALPVALSRGRMTVAVAYRAADDWNRNETRRITVAAGRGTYTITEVGGASAISPAVAVALGDRVSLGATVNVLGGSWERQRSSGAVWATGYPANTGREYADIAGTSVDVGVLARPLPKLRAGLRVGLPYERTYLELEHLALGTFPGKRRRLEVPATMAVGVAYSIGADRTVSLDVRSEPWTQAVWHDESADTVLVEDHGDHDVLALGLGYARSSSTRGFRGRTVFVTTRLGLFYLPSSDGDTRGDRIVRYGVAAGRTWRTGRLTFDLGLVYRQSSEYDRSVATYRSPMTERDLDVVMGLRWVLLPAGAF